jgi:hypothetical protein
MPVQTQCRICTSPYEKEVNELLYNNKTYPEIAKFLLSKSITLSTTSIGRHNNNHRLKKNKKSKKSKKGKKKSSKKPHIRQAARGIVAKEQYGTRKEAASATIVNKLQARKNILFKDIKNMSQDIDVLDKMQEMIHLAEDRLYRALLEERSTKMVLTVTSNAFKDYNKALKDYHEITAGMDSATQVRFAQLVGMIGNVFVDTSISDKSRLEMLDVVKEYDIDAIPEPPPEVKPLVKKDKDKSKDKPEVVENKPIEVKTKSKPSMEK